ncbi:hypothetical protein [Candidatus Thiosymbion oneisti]|uniref:type II toxin-antitoxin system RelE family toxin n=1 Tax=Candidatus Thiosymbion oneisti TaxID=589554 RepID=UPI000B7C62B4
MNSKTTKQFRKVFSVLPKQIQNQATKAYRQFKEDPWHPSLRLKQIHPSIPIYSVRIGKGYRAVGQRNGNSILWFWIGSHEDYNKLRSQQ